MRSTGCPPPEDLASLIDGLLPQTSRSDLLTHVVACQDCYTAFVETARFLEQGKKRRRFHPRWLTLAAAAVLCLAVGWFVTSRDSAPPAGPRAVTSSPVAAESPFQSRVPWLESAPWNGSGDTRFGFAPAPASRRQLLLGFHLAALDRACSSPQPVREQVLGNVQRSLEGSGLVSTAQGDRLAKELGTGECPLLREATSDWTELGRTIEAWRIAAVERDAAAREPERAREVADRLVAVQAGTAVQRLARRLEERLRKEGVSWDDLLIEIATLIELVSA